MRPSKMFCRKERENKKINRGVRESRVLENLLFDIHEAQGDVVVSQIVVEGAEEKDKDFKR